MAWKLAQIVAQKPAPKLARVYWIATQVATKNNGAIGSISFQSFENFGCILDQRNDWQVMKVVQ